MNGVLVFAHGSRDPLWRRPIEAVAAAIQAQSPDTLVRCAYLELCSPDLPAAAAELVAQGCRHIRILPVFFGMGRHAREDLPQLLEQLRQQHPDVAVVQLPAAGEDPRVVQVLAQLAVEPTP